ncbi:MAG: chemotaxis protein CheW [Campylobacterales bacterium]
MSDNTTSTKLTLKDRYLTFKLENELYGIDIFRIKEIIAMMNVTKVPRTPAYVSGVINLRGAIIPIVDTRLRFGMEPKEPEMQTAIIITEINKVSIGFIVDNVEEVISVEADKLSEPPKFGTGIDTAFIRNMAQVGDNVVMILDLEKLFELTELSQFEAMAQQAL